MKESSYGPATFTFILPNAKIRAINYLTELLDSQLSRFWLSSLAFILDL